MNTKYFELFIKSGANLEINLLRQCSIMFSVFFMFSFFFAKQSNEISKILSYIILFSCIITIIAIFILTSFEYTTKKRILINLIFPNYIILNSVIFAIILFTMKFGYSMYLFFIITPPIFFTVLILIYSIIKIKKEANHIEETKRTYKKIYTKPAGIIGAISGIVGMSFAKKYFKNANQEFLILIVVAILVLLACSLTFSIKNILKLYYLKKFENMGIHINTPIKSGLVYVKKQND